MRNTTVESGLVNGESAEQLACLWASWPPPRWPRRSSASCSGAPSTSSGCCRTGRSPPGKLATRKEEVKFHTCSVKLMPALTSRSYFEGRLGASFLNPTWIIWYRSDIRGSSSAHAHDLTLHMIITFSPEDRDAPKTNIVQVITRIFSIVS